MTRASSFLIMAGIIILVTSVMAGTGSARSRAVAPPQPVERRPSNPGKISIMVSEQ